MNPNDFKNALKAILGHKFSHFTIDCSPHTFSVERLSSKEIDRYVCKFNFGSLGDYWNEIDRPNAEFILAHILNIGLAHRSEFMDSLKAKDFARRFIDYFDTDSCRFFTSVVPESYMAEDMSWSDYNEITSSSFDAGVILADDKKLGIIWQEDED